MILDHLCGVEAIAVILLQYSAISVDIVCSERLLRSAEIHVSNNVTLLITYIAFKQFLKLNTCL